MIVKINNKKYDSEKREISLILNKKEINKLTKLFRSSNFNPKNQTMRRPQSNPNRNSNNQRNSKNLPDSNFLEAEVDKSPEGWQLKLSDVNLTDETAPRVSLVTPTARRTWAIPIILRNFYGFNYPRDKLELIIMDSQPTEVINLPEDPRIKYHMCDVNVPLWEKRNMLNEIATGDIIIHLDDDDYYFDNSIWAKVKVLEKYQCDVVGCTDIGVYHLLENYSYLTDKGKSLAEASMAYRRSFWEERPLSVK